MKTMIFFVCNMWPEDMSRGITKKAYAQMEAMERLGNKVVYYTGYKNDGVYVFDYEGNVVKKKLFKKEKSRFNRIVRSYYLKILVSDFFKEKHENINVLYSRYFFFDLLTINMFKNAKRQGCFNILELHSYPCYFKGRYSKYPLYFLDYLCRKNVLKYIDRIAAMTDTVNIWNKETINFENGIDLNNTKPHVRNREKNIMRIIAVSYEWEVHGYDRLLRGLVEYYSTNDIKTEVHVIFVGTVLDSTRVIIQKFGLEKYVTLAGIKSGDELDKIYDECDIGMGCMALHRRANNAVSDLKTREYAAKGIPYIYAGNQLGEDFEFKYAYKMDEGEDALNINEIIQFYNMFKDDCDIVENMRTWAQNYTWDKQLSKVLDF